MSGDTDKPKPRHLDPNYGRVKRSKKHEKRLGERLGGKRIPRSGGLPWSRWDPTTANGDISVPDFHFEHKRTDCKSMALQLEWLVKVAEGARRTLKDPGVIVTFEQKGKIAQEWVLVPLPVLERLIAAAKPV